MFKKFGTAKKKPVVIHWFKWSSYDISALKELEVWVESFIHKTGDLVKFHDIFEFEMGRTNIRIKTLEGTSYDLPDGYIIVRGVEGEFYPCEPNIFEKTYDIKGVI